MAIGITASSGIVQYGVYHYTVDTEDDKSKLRRTDKMGSTVYVIDSKTKYILNGKKEWVPMGTSSSGGSDSGGGCDCDPLNVATEPEVDEMLEDIFNDGGEDGQDGGYEGDGPGGKPADGEHPSHDDDELRIATEPEIDEMLNDVFTK